MFCSKVYSFLGRVYFFSFFFSRSKRLWSFAFASSNAPTFVSLSPALFIKNVNDFIDLPISPLCPAIRPATIAPADLVNKSLGGFHLVSASNASVNISSNMSKLFFITSLLFSLEQVCYQVDIFHIFHLQILEHF